MVAQGTLPSSDEEILALLGEGPAEPVAQLQRNSSATDPRPAGGRGRLTPAQGQSRNALPASDLRSEPAHEPAGAPDAPQDFSATATQSPRNRHATRPRSYGPEEYFQSEEEIVSLINRASEPTARQKAQESAHAFISSALNVPALALEGVAIPLSKIPRIPKGPSELAKRVAEAVREAGENIVPTTGLAKAQSATAPQIAGGLGSLTGFLAGGQVGAAARIPSWLSIGLLGASTNGAAGYLEAISQGADEETAFRALLGNAAVGTSEIVPVSKILARINKASGGALSKVLVDAVVEGSEEYVQEGFQTLAGNLIAQHLYDEEREALEGVLQSAEGGFFSTVIGSALASGASRRLARRTAEPQEAHPAQLEAPPGLTPIQEGDVEPAQEAPAAEELPLQPLTGLQPLQEAPREGQAPPAPSERARQWALEEMTLSELRNLAFEMGADQAGGRKSLIERLTDLTASSATSGPLEQAFNKRAKGMAWVEKRLGGFPSAPSEGQAPGPTKGPMAPPMAPYDSLRSQEAQEAPPAAEAAPDVSRETVPGGTVSQRPLEEMGVGELRALAVERGIDPKGARKRLLEKLSAEPVSVAQETPPAAERRKSPRLAKLEELREGVPALLEGPEADAWVAKVRAQTQAGKPPEGAPERRGERLRVEDMTDEEMKVALLTDELTKLPNKRAFNDFEASPVVASVDGDSVAFINDNFGHDVGDKVLKAYARALANQTDRAFRLGGDEYAVRGETTPEIKTILRAADAELAKTPMWETTIRGRPAYIPRIGLTWGIASDFKTADDRAALKKIERQQQGLRAERKLPPPGILFGEIGESMEAFQARVKAAQTQGRNLQEEFPTPPQAELEAKKPKEAEEAPAQEAAVAQVPTEEAPQAPAAAEPTKPRRKKPAAKKTEPKAEQVEAPIDGDTVARFTDGTGVLRLVYTGGRYRLEHVAEDGAAFSWPGYAATSAAEVVQKLVERGTQGLEVVHPYVVAAEQSHREALAKKQEQERAERTAREEKGRAEAKFRVDLDEAYRKAKPKLRKATVQISRNEGPLGVEGFTSGQGLAITRMPGASKWTITHEPSGLAVLRDLPQRDARFALWRLLPLQDWTVARPDKAANARDIIAAIKALQGSVHAPLPEGLRHLERTLFYGGIPPIPVGKAIKRVFFQRPPITIDEDGGTTIEPETGWQVFRRLIEDRFLRVRQVQEALPKKSKASNVSQAQRLFTGRTKARLDELEHRHVRPIQETLRTIGDLKAAEDYLYALHAPERNAVMAERHPKKFGKTPGSGMSNEEAARIVQKAEKGPQGAAFKDLAKKVRALNEERLELLVESGLLSNDVAELWRKTYPTYVPLRTNAPGSRANLGPGFHVRGPESKRAKGRRSLADHPLLFSILQAQEGIVRAEKNKVGQAMLELVRENPYPGLWSISEGRPKPTVQEDGEIRRPTDDRFTLGERSVAVKEDGKEWIITFADPLMARAMKNLSAQEGGKFLQAAQKVVRFYSQLHTSYNPEFVVSNFLRDLQTAGINISAEKSAGLSKKITKDVFKSMRGAFRALRDPDAKGAWEDTFREYRSEGGKIDWYYTESIDEKLAQFEKLLEGVQSPQRKAAIVMRSTVEFIDDLNGAVENGIRLSTFKHLRDAGVSGPDAAEYARGLTVDFNQKGEWGAVLNTLYLFFNAGVQGTARMVKTMGTKRGQQIAGGIAASAFLLSILNQLGGGEDDDGIPYWEKIPEETKDRNLIVLIPGTEGKRIMFPLPWGFNVLYSLGRNAAALMPEELGGIPEQGVAESAGNMIRSAWGAFSPLGSEPTLSQMVSPTLVDPIVQLGENVAFHGGPITKEPFPTTTTPRSQLYWSSTSEPAKWVAAKLNAITGGSQARPGKLDVSPDAIEHVTEFFTGGAGRFLMNTGKTGWDLASGERPRLSEVPFLRRVLGEPNEWWDTSRFFDNKAELSILEDELELSASPAERAAFLERWRGVLGLKQAFSATEKAAKAARTQGNEELARNLYRRLNAQFRSAKREANR